MPPFGAVLSVSSTWSRLKLPAFWLGGSIAETYTLVHLLDSLFMAAVLYPAFLMARMYMKFAPSVLAALFAVAAPAMNYAGLIGTETLAATSS